MIRLQLTADQEQELARRLRQRGAAVPAIRLEMVRLASQGQRIPAIARDLGCHEQTARKFVKAFRDRGFAGLEDRPRPGRPRRLTDAHLTALEALLDGSIRSWTTPQLADWLVQEHGVPVHPDHLSQQLQRRGFAWKRTKRSVAHKRKDADLYDAKAGEIEDFVNRPSRG